MHVLWVSPNLNDYKARFLDVLVSNNGPELTVLAGAPHEKAGHKYGVKEHSFERINVGVSRSRFAFSPTAFFKLWRLIRRRDFDLVIMPVEKIHLPMIVFLGVLRWVSRFRLLCYNHPCLRNSAGRITYFNLKLTKFLFAFYDRVIFYTEQSREWAIQQKLISARKASFANNTLDTDSIWKSFEFSVNRSQPCRLLFIGRLVPPKRFDLLFRYYEKVRQQIPDLQLDIVGDGPLQHVIDSEVKKYSGVTWHGALTDEDLIAERMCDAHAVFVPGHSGLSIVHAFCYGKPFMTLTGPGTVQPPEIDYLQDNVNGLTLHQSEDENISRIVESLRNSQSYESMCNAAFETARGITVQHWKQDVQAALQLTLDGAES